MKYELHYTYAEEIGEVDDKQLTSLINCIKDFKSNNLISLKLVQVMD